MSQQFIVGLDIGTHSIKGVVGITHSKDGHRFIKAFRVPSGGMRKGMVVDMDEASRALTKATDEVRALGRGAMKHVFVNIGSAQVEVKNSKGFVVVSRGDDVISQEDVDRVIQASETINLQSNREILHAIPREYTIDGMGDIQDPVGLSGARLEVESSIIHGFSSLIKNIHRCAEVGGFKIFGLVFSPLAVSQFILSKAQRDLGVISIDLGASTTSIAVFEEGKLIHAKVFPIGAANITNDIAIGLKVPIAIAESVKLTFGAATSKEISRKDQIDIAKVAPGFDGSVSRRFISEIIQIRLEEIFGLVNAELKKIDRQGRLPGGVVLTGGGAKMPGIIDLVKSELRLPAQIGAPSDVLGHTGKALKDYFDDPDMSLAAGLSMWGMREFARPAQRSVDGRVGHMVRWLRQLLP